ncbi:MAG: hypothetical protein KH009_07365 [Clostridiales bacterium]|nr:hypothetical protein [Clostridiales bacterium]
MHKFFAGAAAAVSAAALSVTTALASPAATLLRTEYERYQQSLPLFERDKWIAEPGLFAIVVLLTIYLVWKLRRDMRKSREEDAKYRALMAEAEKLQAAEDEAEKIAADAAIIEASAAGDADGALQAEETFEALEATAEESAEADPEETPDAR